MKELNLMEIGLEANKMLNRVGKFYFFRFFYNCCEPFCRANGIYITLPPSFWLGNQDVKTEELQTINEHLARFYGGATVVIERFANPVELWEVKEMLIKKIEELKVVYLSDIEKNRIARDKEWAELMKKLEENRRGEELK